MPRHSHSKDGLSESGSYSSVDHDNYCLVCLVVEQAEGEMDTADLGLDSSHLILLRHTCIDHTPFSNRPVLRSTSFGFKRLDYPYGDHYRHEFVVLFETKASRSEACLSFCIWIICYCGTGSHPGGIVRDDLASE